MTWCMYMCIYKLYLSHNPSIMKFLTSIIKSVTRDNWCHHCLYSTYFFYFNHFSLNMKNIGTLSNYWVSLLTIFVSHKISHKNIVEVLKFQFTILYNDLKPHHPFFFDRHIISHVTWCFFPYKFANSFWTWSRIPLGVSYLIKIT